MHRCRFSSFALVPLLLGSLSCAIGSAPREPDMGSAWLPLRDGVRWGYDVHYRMEFRRGDQRETHDDRFFRLDGLERIEGPTPRYLWTVYAKVEKGQDRLTDGRWTAPVLIRTEAGVLEVGTRTAGVRGADPEDHDFDTPRMRLPRTLTKEASWPQVHAYGDYREESEGRVVGFERVRTPAGEFEGVAHVRYDGVAMGRGHVLGGRFTVEDSRYELHEWFARGIGKVKKIEVTVLRGRDERGQAVIVRTELRMELRDHWAGKPERPAIARPKKVEPVEETACRVDSGLLARAEHAELDRRLDGLQAEFERGEVDSQRLSREILDCAMGERAQLDAWVAAQPESWAARTVRGAYWSRQGWNARGTALARNTSERQWRAMREAFVSAARDLTRALELNPRAPVAHYELLRIVRSTGDVEAGRRIFEALLEVDPGAARPYVFFMDSLEPKWGGSVAALESLSREARQKLGDGPEADAVEASYWARRAILAMNAHEYRAAADYTRRTIALRGDHYDHHRMVNILRSDGRLRAALDTVDVRITSGHADATDLLQRAQLYRMLGWLDYARDDLAVAARWAPGEASTWVQLANLEYRLDDYDAALAAYDRVVKRYPDSPSYWAGRGSLLLDMERYEEAARSYWRAIQLAESVPAYWLAYAGSLQMSGNREAEAAYRRFLALAGDDPRHAEAVERVESQLREGLPASPGR